MQQIGFLLENLLFAQHASGTIMPIIRRSRIIQMVAACDTWCFGLQVVGLVRSCAANRKHNSQLHTRPTTCKSKRQVPQAATICITFELLMMGIMVPETCWANSKFSNKKTNLLHLVGLLFPRRFVMSVRLCVVLLSASNNSAPTGWIFMKFYFWVFFRKSVTKKFKFR